MTDIFAACGNAPVFKERLNSLVTTGVIVAAVAWSMWAEIPSGLLAFGIERATGPPPQYTGDAYNKNQGLF